jgi:hypothetical protein
VCEVTIREDGVSVTVAYGTSQALRQLHAGEFAITKQGHLAAYGAAGLSFDTKFDLRQRIELPWTEDFFTVPAHAPHGQPPKLGSLHGSMMRALQALTKRCAKEIDGVAMPRICGGSWTSAIRALDR